MGVLTDEVLAPMSPATGKKPARLLRDIHS